MEKSKAVVFNALKEKRNLLEPEAMDLLKEYGVPVPVYRVAASQQDALDGASEIGYPVVMKIISRDIIHKTDAGCVMLDLKSPGEVNKAYIGIMENAKKFKEDASISGVVIYPSLPRGTEVIIGMTEDAQFGKTVMFGLGGIFVEVLKDVTFRIVPLEKKDAREMISEVKGRLILDGIRGEKPRDIRAIEDMIMGISRLCCDYPEIDEIDLNPVFVYENGAAVADARIILKQISRGLPEQGMD